MSRDCSKFLVIPHLLLGKEISNLLGLPPVYLLVPRAYSSGASIPVCIMPDAAATPEIVNLEEVRACLQ
jgi:hypothetical protein